MLQNIYTEEEQHWCRGGNTGMLPTRITPSQVNILEDGEIFVFGSNFHGAHMGGSFLSRQAVRCLPLPYSLITRKGSLLIT